ncbi:MAG: HoxN/HupN/NixA family nickel/cobalt transporter [Rhodospirillales bacterium]|nr:HoxN/HupN/NixA family nickel/cobalt transporter [Rhodospirillales bacterium]
MARAGGFSPIFAGLIAANGLTWGWAWVVFKAHPALLGTALLAWVFGLRHALDADHIAAIDNVVRRLMADGQRPVSVGLWFSLGHSSVVALAALALALAGTAAETRLPAIARIGALAGTVVSGAFLFAVAAMNLGLLRGQWCAWRRGAASEPPATSGLTSGPLARLFRPLLAAVRVPWRMYPVGFLFGLGFDTATEVGLLALSAGAAMGGMAVARVMVFPALFAAGMSLVDTADSALMVRAYGWSARDPLRKLWYAMTMTFASVMVALLVGGMEIFGLIAARLHPAGAGWRLLTALSNNMAAFGAAIVTLFAACWAVSAALFRLGRRPLG